MSIGAIFNKISEPRNSAAFTAINLLLGVGPLIIPEPFFKAGFFFSLFWTIVVCLLSLVTSSYIGESIVLINKHMDETKLAQVDEAQPESAEYIESEDNQTTYIRTFDHGEIISYLYGEKWQFIPSLAVSIYLLGASVSKCIMTGNTLSKLFSDVPFLDNYYFWLAIFFIFGATFSFKSIQKTKVIQTTMIAVRFLSVFLMIIGAFIIMGQNGQIKDLAPVDGNIFFNIEYFGDIFSNLLFAFMIHHSMPGITKQLTELSQIQSFLNIGFLISGITMLIIPITAVFAFGNDLTHYPIDTLTLDHSLIYYNQDFKGKLDFIYYIVSFYVFLNVAAFPVYIIVIRRNILSIIKPSVNSDRLCKSTIFMSSAILAVVLVISFAMRQYIQTALNFTGGIFGCLILFLLPSIQILKARSLFPSQNRRTEKIPYILMVVGILSMGFNLYQTISNLID